MLPRDTIGRCARNYPDKIAYRCGERSATWRRMDERSDRFGAALQRLGHRPGQTVAILTQETIEVYEQFFACMKSGAPRVGRNTQYPWPEMLHVIVSAETLVDGWLRTNDIGRLDERGYLYLLDRQKFMIIAGAVNVFPSSVEAALVEHPAVEEVAVVGVPHPEWGEAVVAVVVRRPAGAQAIAGDVIGFCKGRLSRPETPKHVVFTDALPKTSNGKVKKNDLKQWLRSTPGVVPWTTTVE